MARLKIPYDDPSGYAVFPLIDEVFATLASGNKSVSRPADLLPGGRWVQEISATEWRANLYDGEADIALFTINAVTHEVSYPVAAAVESLLLSATISAAGVGTGEGQTATEFVGFGTAVGEDQSGATFTGVGHWAGSRNTGANGVFIGNRPGNDNAGSQCVFMGDTGGTRNTGHRAIGIGTFSLNDNAGAEAIGLGLNAGVRNTFRNAICIGASTTATGSNQFILGDANTDAYANSYQLRSDLNDKADIEQLALGREFINSLNPVSHVHDKREFYKDINYVESGELNEDGSAVVEVEVIDVPKDGSRKLTRRHAALIAQEVKQALDDAGIDLGLYQDHSISGGDDVKTLNYIQLIPILIKASQEHSAEFEEVTATLAVQQSQIAAQNDAIVALQAQVEALAAP